MQKHITLIGGSGFVGTRLIDQLKGKDFVLQNLDKQQSFFHSDITKIVNVRNTDDLIPLLQNTSCVVLLAAEHRDDVSPVSLYYDVNVEGTKNVLKAMDVCGIKKIIFTSSVAVYGLNKTNPNEEHPQDPFNHYGKSKWQAEEILRDWYNNDKQNKCLSIIRPTVIFGERNRGNVYNLLNQIVGGAFFKIGDCENKKSMAYVGNIVSFIEFLITKNDKDYSLYNYVDKPDFTMNELVSLVSKVLNKKIPSYHIPYWIGMAAGYSFDLFSKLTGTKQNISSVRVKKFCATTQFDASKVKSSGFQPPYTLEEGLSRTLTFEFLHEKNNDITFVSE